MSRARTRHIKERLLFTDWPHKTWNGLIMLGKDREPRLLKALKPMQHVYLYSRYDWPQTDEWRYGCGFYVGREMVYFRDVISGSEYLISRKEIESFSIYKFVGNKNVYFDATDDDLKARAAEAAEKLAQMADEDVTKLDTREVRFQAKSMAEALDEE